jgi:hypothetical protein
MINGKSKVDFNNWLIANREVQDIKNKDKDMHHWLTFKGFKNLPLSMQFGVYIDFFQSVGVYIFITETVRSGEWLGEVNSIHISSETRSEVRIIAIQTANESYNAKP